MNKRFFSAIVSIAMMATMIPMSVYAADEEEPVVDDGVITDFDTGSSGSVDVEGSSLEGHVNKNVFHMVVPTDATVQSTLKFIMDPEELLEETDAVSLDIENCEITTEGSTLFFKNADADGDVTGISNTSDPLTIINKSSVDVTVKVSASLSNIDGIKLATSDTFGESDIDPSLYLAISNADESAPSAVSNEAPGCIEKKLNNAAGQYEITYDGSTYKYDLVEEPDADEFDKLNFTLTGAANPNADWSDLTNASPTITIVWEFSSDQLKEKYVSTNSISSADETIRIGKGKVIETYQYTKVSSTGSTSLSTVSATKRTLEDNVLKIDSSIFEGGTELVLTFDDGHVERITFVKS